MDLCWKALPDPSPSSPDLLVKQLRLEPHPEGGWFREVHRSSITVRRGDGEERCALTLIWFLLTAEEISRWHRVMGADETWHHAGGAPLELWILPPSGGVAELHLLGPLDGTDTPGGPQPVQVVPAAWWQAARCLGSWTLVNCCVAPGFDFQDFQLLSQRPTSVHPPGALIDLL